jgi:Predicted glutamine amidotransferase
VCELLGVSVSPPAILDVYFKAFRPRAERNRSGWGVGWYENGEARVVKEARRADESEKAAALIADPPSSHLFIVHVRRATVGPIADRNTHPFVGSLWGRDWMFAHNGTVRNLARLPLREYEVIGDTDSEVAFYYLLTRLAQLDPDASDERRAAEVLEGARALSRDGQANFLLTDGRNLYAYYDGHMTFHFLQREPHAPRTWVADDSDYVVGLRTRGTSPERAVIFASIPLTEESWTRLRPGEFLICRDGQVIERIPPIAPRLTLA